jgi:hypothetical protein
VGACGVTQTIARIDCCRVDALKGSSIADDVEQDYYMVAQLRRAKSLASSTAAIRADYRRAVQRRSLLSRQLVLDMTWRSAINCKKAIRKHAPSIALAALQSALV